MNTESIQIFLRLRPIMANGGGVGGGAGSNGDHQKRRQIIANDDKIVSIMMNNSNDNQMEQFEFDHVFNTNANQLNVFNRICRPMIESMIHDEKDGLLFAYGATSSGKSYTINGMPKTPGLIPRTLAYLFDKITVDKLNRKNSVRSNRQNGFFIVNNNNNHDNNENDGDDDWWPFDKAIASMNPSNERRYSQTLKQWSNIGIEIFDDDDDDDKTAVATPITTINGKKYSIFLSFIEIYNNYIYDLLEIPDPKQMKLERTKRTLINDTNQMVYVHGAEEIEARNLNQAFRCYLFGLQNRQIAQTMMNEQSSRSHSVFTIKLIHNKVDDNGGDNKPQLKVNQFSIIDLAGLERANRTKNTGRKLCEAGQINSSLMTLRACFDAIQKMNNNNHTAATTTSSDDDGGGGGGQNKNQNQNQNQNGKIIIPYRQSRLTYLLKRFFESRSTTIVRMILCVCLNDEDLNENLRILNFGKKVQRIRLLDTGVHIRQQQKQELSGDSVQSITAGDNDDDDDQEDDSDPIKIVSMKNIEKFRQKIQQLEVQLNHSSVKMESICKCVCGCGCV